MLHRRAVAQIRGTYVIFPSRHRLVDLHEREIRVLRAHGIPIEIQKAAFEEAMNRVVRSTVAGVAEVSGESWRVPAQKSSKALVVYRALPAQTSSQNPPQPELNQRPARRATDRFVETWNGNSSDKPVTRYTSRKAGVARLWKASQLLEGGMEPSDAERLRPAKPAKRTTAMKAKAAQKAAPTKKARDKRSASSNKRRPRSSRLMKRARGVSLGDLEECGAAKWQ